MSARNEVIELLNKRKSIRKFKKKAVPSNLVDQILQCGQRAPTACRMEPYSFILISDEMKRDMITEACVTHEATKRYMKESPVWILICVDFARQIDLYRFLEINPEMGEISKFILGIIDSSLAAENMVIAAEAFGLSSCFVGSIWTHPLIVSEILDLPKYVFPLILLCLGYPDEEPQIRDRWPLKTILHYNKYSKESNQELLEYSQKRKSWEIGYPYKMDNKLNKNIKIKLKKIGFKL